jgi:hypothetical protein
MDDQLWEINMSLHWALPNKRLKLAARVDYGMDSSSARPSLSAIR